ncbi:hypothetical protein DFH06DRAFT_1242047 [Mycena polygramma]|nr:hypothetical protein DFH06DRAFT_1242047 [Mycena polygramma]
MPTACRIAHGGAAPTHACTVTITALPRPTSLADPLLAGHVTSSFGSHPPACAHVPGSTVPDSYIATKRASGGHEQSARDGLKVRSPSASPSRSPFSFPLPISFSPLPLHPALPSLPSFPSHPNPPRAMRAGIRLRLQRASRGESPLSDVRMYARRVRSASSVLPGLCLDASESLAKSGRTDTLCGVGRRGFLAQKTPFPFLPPSPLPAPSSPRYPTPLPSTHRTSVHAALPPPITSLFSLARAHIR